MPTLVTGATGFLGSAVVRALLSEGETVRVLVRNNSNLSNINNYPVEKVIGDLSDVNSLKLAVKGCNSLFHVAADYRLWVPDPEQMYNINVEGTRLLMSVAGEAGIKKIIYTSSVAVLGKGINGQSANEDSPVKIEDMIGHYKRSKFLAEAEVRRMIEEDGLSAIIVNPSAPVGICDIKPTPTGKIIVDFANNKMPAYVDTGLNLVNVDDCAKGHLLAYEHGRVGQRYILGGENMKLKSILDNLSMLSGQKAPSIKLPHKLLMPVAHCSEAFGKLFNNEPRITVDALRMSQRVMFFSSEKAKKEIHYRTRPVVDALGEALEWFYQNGYTQVGLKNKTL